MVSPVPKHLRTDLEHDTLPTILRGHVVNLDVTPTRDPTPRTGIRHRAKFAPGLIPHLIRLADTDSIGDPMAGCGMVGWMTDHPVLLNDLDDRLAPLLDPLADRGCTVTYQPAAKLDWNVDAVVFSPPYYPKADRRKPSAHDDAKRGPVVGFRDSYGCDHPDFVGDPAGVDAIAHYRTAMRRIYENMHDCAKRMIVVTKNWTRLGVELRLDLDTILMAIETGWWPVERHGWIPNPSLWARYNNARGGGVLIEDVMVFDA